MADHAVLAPTKDESVSPASLAIAHVVFAIASAAWWIPHTRDLAA
jgi:hypothetical protein